MTDSDLYRIVPLPVFPPVSDDGAAPPPADPFSPNELLGGFLSGPENRYAELAVRFAIDGVPIFARPLGDRLDANADLFARRDGDDSRGVSNSRADAEILFRAAIDRAVGGDKIDAFFERNDASDSPTSPTKSARSANSSTSRESDVRPSPFPPVVGRRPLEDANFLTPLVFYGPSGSGKTRLVEGVCRNRRLLDPRKTLYYLSGTDFFQALVNAIRRDQTPIFRRLFAQADVVAIENADVLARREAAQLEFLPILDAAIKKRKLVILTFSKNPSEIPGFFPELAARLGGGLLVPTRLPSRGTKRFAVVRVANRLRWRLSDAALDLCVARLPSSIGGLCGALVQAAREFSATATAPTPENLAAFLDKRNPAPEWTLDKIVKTVAKYFSVSVVETRSAKRSKTLVLARGFVAFLARKLTNATLQEIGREFSDREHSTVLFAVRELEAALETDPTLQKNLRDLVEILRAQDVFDADESD